MIPIIYDSNEKAFISNGLGRLKDCLSAVVTEERNGIYEAELQYPTTGDNFDLIQPGRIVLLTHDDTGDTQPFDIVGASKPIDGVVTFHAVHVSYRLAGSTVYGSNINSLADAFSMFAGADPDPEFTFTADFTSSNYMASADGTPRTVRQFLGGIEGSVLDSYGGEYEWDRWNVILHQSRGQVRPLAIRYGVNMTAYQEDVDYQGSYTACVPFWTGTDTDGSEVKVIAGRVDSGAAGYAGRTECVPMDLTDKFETKPTTAQLQTEAASQMRNQQPYLPAQTIAVDFVRLQDMSEYEGLGELLTCRLCDTVTVYFPAYGTQGQFKIVKTVYDVLQERFQSMELGTLSTSLAEALGISETLDKTAGGGGGSFTPTTVTDSGTASSFSSGTTLHSLGVSKTMASGIWIIMASARYPSNSTGYRALQITADGTGQNVSLVQQPAGGTGNFDIFTAAIVEKTASWTLDLNGRQNSGSSMNVDWYVRAVKIGE